MWAERGLIKHTQSSVTIKLLVQLLIKEEDKSCYKDDNRVMKYVTYL